MRNPLLLSAFALCLSLSSAKQERPNIIYIIADDMGYGDVSALNPESKIQTPHLDHMAAEGMVFTDAHSSSSVCTPTRYNVMTGRYNWRTKLQRGVVNGYEPPLIEADRLTIANLLQENGYNTAMIGKWHLGMNHPFAEPPASYKKNLKNLVINWDQPLTGTPTCNGFDYFWGHNASLDFPPYNYIENDRYQSQNLRYVDKKLMKSELGITKGFRPGWIADNFDPFETLDEFYDRSAEYILKADKDTPFFLYIPLTSPHTPIIPTSEWKGKSGLGDYGDFVMQTDAGVGQILSALDAAGITENTLILFTADNGCSPAADIDALIAQGHFPNYIYRGAKADIWEGGHRVPHIVRWPAAIKAGTQTDRLTVLGDIVATAADIIATDLPADGAEDSVSFLPTLIGKTEETAATRAIVNHSISGQFAIRTPEWKLIFTAGSGGWSKPKDKDAAKQGLPKFQLYNMIKDPQETTNLYTQFPEVEKRLYDTLMEFIENGRSTPGPKLENDVPVAFSATL
ncbi:MAG: sulfatase family protein [Opitutales bacterium]